MTRRVFDSTQHYLVVRRTLGFELVLGKSLILEIWPDPNLDSNPAFNLIRANPNPGP
jgi:hypothetical protein